MTTHDAPAPSLAELVEALELAHADSDINITRRDNARAALLSAIARLEAENARLLSAYERTRAERAAILAVPTTDGMTASEWVLRTAIAESRAKKLEAENAALVEKLATARALIEAQCGHIDAVNAAYEKGLAERDAPKGGDRE